MDTIFEDDELVSLDLRPKNLDEVLEHYGTKRHSGRYPWGSGEEPYQHGGDFLSRVEGLQADGFSEKDIASQLKMSTTDLRMQMRVAKHQRRDILVDRARALTEDGKTPTEIARIMGYEHESSVRALLKQSTATNKNVAKATAEVLKKELESKDAIDISAGVELTLGCSRGALKEAAFILETEGYNKYTVSVPQVNNTKHQTKIDIMCKPEFAEYKDAYMLRDENRIGSVEKFHSEDGGKLYFEREYPSSLDSKRVAIRYGDEGGLDKDGVIELRRGVDDLNLGNSHYAQVRILVDGTHFLKGMAIYSDDMPEGKDIVFNTNKASGTPMMKVLKPITADPDLPFGAVIAANGQSYYTGSDGKRYLSPINKLKEEGDWDRMSKNLSSQFLSKQPVKLIKQQLDLTYANAKEQYDIVCSLNNKDIRRKMLLDFADQCDASAVDLKAAALPRQSTQVILPLSKMPENEIYARYYRNGEQVALVRYPHAGTFEIPILTVNNKNKSGKDILGDVTDAVGINAKVAERLSGADFDGDQVVVIPLSSKVRINSTRALDGLKGFDPKTAYATDFDDRKKDISEYRNSHPKLAEKSDEDIYYRMTGVKILPKHLKQREMGMVSNLITDMTLKGAPTEDICRAVKHSMVVIDANKHKLDYKKSEKENGIAELKDKWQKHLDDDSKSGGASTLISLHKHEIKVLERKGAPIIDPETGKVHYRESGRTYLDKKDGKIKTAMTDAKLLLEVDDLHELSSGSTAESLYATHGNKMKALANEARKEYLATPRTKYDPQAKIEYASEVASINSKLKNAMTNAPRERQAQLIANSRINAKVKSNPDLQGSTEEAKKARKKVGMYEIAVARKEVAASGKENRVDVTEREWEAIQKGAISSSQAEKVFRYMDPERLKQLATPRSSSALPTAKINRIKALSSRGYTPAEIADYVGVSASTVSKYLLGKEAD